jgi:peptidyl-prolyl cis-trans isomerase A (cyclophilin A)
MKHMIIAAIALTSLGCETGTGSPAPTKDDVQKPATVGAAATPAKAPAADKAKGPFPESKDPAMTDPSKAKDKAPDTFSVKFDTTFGAFTVACQRDWAPNGADRFYNLVKIGYFDDVAFFRAVPKFMVQFGIHGNTAVSKKWRNSNIEPDEVKEGNKRGHLTFAMAGRPDTRSTQLFINFKNNDRLDKMGFASICKVDDAGMKIVDKVHQGYAEKAGRDQANIQNKGNKYLRERYPKLDYIKTARFVETTAPDAKDGDAKDADSKDTQGDDAKKSDDAKKAEPAAKDADTKPAPKAPAKPAEAKQ